MKKGSYKHVTYYLSTEAQEGLKLKALDKFISVSKLVDLYGRKLYEESKAKEEVREVINND